MPKRSAIAVADAVLVRGLIPLWLLAGAFFKLVERNPGNLPSTFISFAKEREIEAWLNPFMRFAIGTEILAAAIIIFVPRLSRTVAIVILTLFCAILIKEIDNNASSCGCMGAVAMSPTAMLAIDGALLLGAITLGVLRRREASAQPAAKRSMAGALIAAVIGVIGFVVAIALPERTVEEEPPAANGKTQVTDATPDNGDARPAPPSIDLPPGTMANPDPARLSGFYMISNTNSWVGKPATEIDLIKLMRIWPDDIATGTRHIIFFSRTCDHCESMFHDHLTLPHDRPITAVEIPFDRKNMRGPGAWAMPEVDVQELALPVGPDWIMTPPVIITIEDGIVTCAAETEYEGCLGVEPTHVH